MAAEQWSYIEKAQQLWRVAPRGWLSRPIETHGNGSLDSAIKRVFFPYIDSDRPPTLITVAGFFDEPQKFPYKVISHYPQNLEREHHAYYDIGINLLNEWATNYATCYFFKQMVPEQISNLVLPLAFQTYAKIMSLGTQSYQVGSTLNAIRRAARKKEAPQVNFDEAIFSALFQHDFKKLDRLIFYSRKKILQKTYSKYYYEMLEKNVYPSCQNTTDLAVLLGATLERRSVFGHLNRYLNAEDYQTSGQKLAQRIKESVLIGGMSQYHGISEVTGSSYVFLGLASAAFCQMLIPEQKISTSVLIGSIVGMGNAVVLVPFATIHEVIHDYSRSKDYLGLIPQKTIPNNSSLT